MNLNITPSCFFYLKQQLGGENLSSIFKEKSIQEKGTGIRKALKIICLPLILFLDNTQLQTKKDINRKQVLSNVQFLIENSSCKTSTSRKSMQHLCIYSHLLFMALKIYVTFSYQCTLQDLTFCFESSTFQLTPCSHLWESKVLEIFQQRKKITTKLF